MSTLQETMARRLAETKGVDLAVQPGAGQPLAAALVQNPNVSVADETIAEKVAHAVKTMRTFVHQSAGANTIMPDGTKLNFFGKTGRTQEGTGGWIFGGVGYYSTDKAEEIAWLENLTKVSTSQVTELQIDERTHTERVVKNEDFAVKAAVQDAAQNSAAAMDPAVTQAVNNLPHVIAATQTQTSQ